MRLARSSGLRAFARQSCHARAAREDRLQAFHLAYFWAYYNGGNFWSLALAHSAPFGGGTRKEQLWKGRWPSVSLRRCYDAPAAQAVDAQQKAQRTMEANLKLWNFGKG